jgi:DNA-binding transcriptional ArsR family regulator
MRTIQYLSRSPLAAVAHPIRQRILDLLVERGPLSGREITGLIPEAPSNPYYHLGVLRKAGLIEVVRTAPRRGVTERYYGSVARTFSLDPAELLGTTGPRGRAVRGDIVRVAREGAESALADLAVALEAGAAGGSGEEPLINLCSVRLTRERAQALRDRLSACLVETLEEGDSTDPDPAGAEYVFYQLFFPRANP